MNANISVAPEPCARVPVRSAQRAPCTDEQQGNDDAALRCARL